MSTTHCMQCGKSFEEPACGPTHAAIAAERLHLKQVEGDPEACDIARAVFPLRVYPDTDLDRELEEAELLSRCYSLPYSIEEIGAAFTAVRGNPVFKIKAIVQTKRALNTGDLKRAKEIVDAVVEKIGAYQTQSYKPDRYIAACIHDGIELDIPQHTRGAGGVLKATSDGHDPWDRRSSRPGDDSPLDALTRRAVNDFLGIGAHRTCALRGMLRFLTQEDLTTVLAECVVLIDDEHLLQAVKMLGPDEVESLNWAALSQSKPTVG